jgi:hypothetical protein
VFEYWLHPTRYRTQLCNDGTACLRKICFFAHTVAELRSNADKPTHVSADAMAAATLAAVRKNVTRKAQGARFDAAEVSQCLFHPEECNEPCLMDHLFPHIIHASCHFSDGVPNGVIELAWALPAHRCCGAVAQSKVNDADDVWPLNCAG